LDLHPLVGGTVAVGGMVAVYLVTANWLGVSEIRSVLTEVRGRLSRR